MICWDTGSNWKLHYRLQQLSNKKVNRLITVLWNLLSVSQLWKLQHALYLDIRVGNTQFLKKFPCRCVLHIRFVQKKWSCFFKWNFCVDRYQISYSTFLKLKLYDTLMLAFLVVFNDFFFCHSDTTQWPISIKSSTLIELSASSLQRVICTDCPCSSKEMVLILVSFCPTVTYLTYEINNKLQVLKLGSNIM